MSQKVFGVEAIMWIRSVEIKKLYSNIYNESARKSADQIIIKNYRPVYRFTIESGKKTTARERL